MRVETERLEQITEGDKNLQRELLGLYLVTLDKCINSLESDTDCKKIMHELKGASGNLGFLDVAALCKKYEESDIGVSHRTSILESLRKFRVEVENFIMEN